MIEASAIRTALSRANKFEQAVFAIACAERATLIVRRLAAPSSVAIYNAVLDAAWNAASTQVAIMTEKRQSLVSVPEATIDDSHRREYYATLVIGILEHAIDAVNSSNTSEAADLACCQALDLYSCFDAIADGLPNVIVDPDEIPRVGPLELEEIEEQFETLRILANGTETRSTLCDRLRERAQFASQRRDSIIASLIEPR